MQVSQVLSLARKHLGGPMESSARLCLAAAVALNDKGDLAQAKKCAIRSLAFSIGTFHEDFARASK